MTHPIAWARWAVLEAARRSGNGHVPSSLSVLDILLVLYRSILKPDDKFILSKGHAALGLYTAFLERDLILRDELFAMGSRDSRLGGHPDRGKLQGLVECSTGSLGHGLPQAVGIALAKKIKGEAGVVYVLVGDLEMAEGTAWECLLLAVRHRLGNLCLIVDDNGSASSTLPVPDMVQAFLYENWNVYLANGHDPIDIERSVQGLSKENPLCVIAKTVKGKGVPEMETSPQEWHRKTPTQEMVDRAYAESQRMLR